MTEVLPGIPEGELRAALAARDGTAGAVAGDWHARPISGHTVSSATGGVWRVAPGAEGAAAFVLKVVHRSDGGHEYWRSSEDPADPMYWKREPRLFASGLLDRLAGGLRAVCLHHAAARGDGSIALWLEDLPDPATAWPVERYGLAARHLGRAQAALVGEHRVPTEPWLSRGWLRAYVERRRQDVTDPTPVDLERTELSRVAFPEPLGDWAREVLARSDGLFAALDRLPQTLCHMDFWPPNLFGGDDETVAVDWAFAGLGFLGEDIGNLVPDTMLDFFVDSRDGDALWDACVSGYLAGLRDGGWKGSDREVRFGVVAAAAVKYAWMVPWLLRRSADPAAVADLERRSGLPGAEVYRRRGEVMRQIHDRWLATPGLGR